MTARPQLPCFARHLQPLAIQSTSHSHARYGTKPPARMGSSVPSRSDRAPCIPTGMGSIWQSTTVASAFLWHQIARQSKCSLPARVRLRTPPSTRIGSPVLPGVHRVTVVMCLGHCRCQLKGPKPNHLLLQPLVERDRARPQRRPLRRYPDRGRIADGARAAAVLRRDLQQLRRHA